MKKAIAFAILLIISVTSFSQQTKPSPALTKQDYLEKSKNQKKAARILLYGGSTCIAISFLIPNGDVIGGNFFYTEYENSDVKSAFFLSGFLSTLISIPVFIASHRNKKKGMKLSFKNEKVPLLQNSHFTNRPVPSLSLKICL